MKKPSNQPAVLLLHGALGSKRQFSQIALELEGDFAAHTLNFEGHGGRPIIREFAMEHFAENALDYLNENNLDEVNIFGYSMGGYVGLTLALAHPDRVKKVVTLGTKFDWSPTVAEKEIALLDAEIIALKVPHFAKKLDDEHRPTDWKKVVHQTASLLRGLSEGAQLSEEDFRRIHTEVVLGLGELDKMVTKEETEAVTKRLPKAKFEILEGIEHVLEKNKAEEVADYIRAQLS